MTRRASIRDVATAAGVSVATVSKVLRGDATVTADYRRRVRAAVELLAYRVDPLAANLRRGQRTLIGVIAPDFENPFFGGVIAALESVAESAGYALVAMSSWENAERETELLGRMRDWRVAGVVVAPVDDGARAVGIMRAFDLKGVVIDRAAPNRDYDSVGVDDTGAAALVAESLIGAGHRRILLVGSGPEARNIVARSEGFGDRAAALAPETRIDVVYCGHDPENMAARLDASVAPGCPYSAVFSLFLPGLMATLAVARARGWRRPRDVTLVSFDDAPWMALIEPAIPAVAQPVRAIGLEAMRLLMARIGGADAPPQAQALRCVYDPRGAVAPPRS